MLKRLVVIPLFAVSMIMVLTAQGESSVFFGGGGFQWNTIHGSSFGGGGGNLDKNIVLIEYGLEVHEVVGRCQNQGGGQGGAGQAFNLKVGVVANDVAEPDPAAGRGKWTSVATITQETLDGTFSAFIQCQNPNWSVIPGSVVVTQFLATLKALACVDESCSNTVVKDQLILNCNLPANAVPGDFYNCPEVP